jgi:hypothetical protein
MMPNCLRDVCQPFGQTHGAQDKERCTGEEFGHRLDELVADDEPQTDRI